MYFGYLKRYKSCSGFISYYGYSFEEWIEYTHDFTDYSDKAHYLGSVLEFICQNEEITEEAMYYSLEVNASEFCTWKADKVKCEICGDWFEVKDFPQYKEYERTAEKQVKIWKETQGDKPYKLKTFNETYPEHEWVCDDCK